MGASISLLGFNEGAFAGWDSGAQGFSGAAMNLNHWVDGVWDSSWVPESFGGVSEGGAVESSATGGGGRKRGKVRLPRKWSDDPLVPVRPEIIVSAATVSQPSESPTRELYLALEKRHTKRNRMKKAASALFAFLDS